MRMAPGVVDLDSFARIARLEEEGWASGADPTKGDPTDVFGRSPVPDPLIAFFTIPDGTDLVFVAEFIIRLLNKVARNGMEGIVCCLKQE